MIPPYSFGLSVFYSRAMKCSISPEATMPVSQRYGENLIARQFIVVVKSNCLHLKSCTIQNGIIPVYFAFLPNILTK